MRDFDPTASEFITSGFLEPSKRHYDIGSIIGAGASLLGSAFGADAQEDAADQAAQLQREQFNKTVELNEPFRQAGLAGQNRLLELLGIGGNKDAADYGSAMRDFGTADFQADPGYQFRLSEGMKGLERAAASRGGLLSGRAYKGLMDYGQGLASQEYGNAFNRFQTNRSNKLNPLQALAGTGQSATNQVSAAGQNYASGAGSAIMGGGNARASGYVGGANAINDSIGGYRSNQLMQRLLGGSGGGESWRTTGSGMPDYN